MMTAPAGLLVLVAFAALLVLGASIAVIAEHRRARRIIRGIDDNYLHRRRK